MQPLGNTYGGLVVLVACAGIGTAACSFVEFEQSPYTPRDLAVVYSEQEDLTFVSWKVGEEADIQAARFELYRDGDYRPIDLDQAPYPADPYACGDDELCLQYQLEGRLAVAADRSPLRTIHETIWGGPTPSLRVVETTFDIDPVAIDNNTNVDPGRFDWFARNDVPLRRDYQLQLVTGLDPCGDVSSDDWRPMRSPTSVDYAWVESPTCLAARPVPENKQAPQARHADNALVVRAPLLPGAETVSDRQVYRPPEEQSPIVYGVLFDLQIANAERCRRIKTSLLGRISSAFEARGETELLDVYYPLSPQSGETIEACSQDPGRYYPADQMLHDAQISAAHHDPTGVRVVWIYVNNSQIPPSQEVLEGLETLGVPSASTSNLTFFFWAIGSNSILNAGPWHARTGWRPIDDETFSADIVSFAKTTLPFLTMMHFSDTEVSIALPEGADQPEPQAAGAESARYFKICTSQPPYTAIGNEPGSPPAFGASSPAIAWPSDSGVSPFYTVDLGQQRMVPYGEFRKRRVETVIEICERFCDHGFRTRGGIDYDNWIHPPASRPQEVCQWTL